MLERALELAVLAGEAGEVPVGAVVYRTDTGAVLAEGANTREGANDPSGHAEFRAIVAACEAAGDWRLTGCSLAVTLEPCVMCAGLIVNARVDRVVFGATDPKAGACVSLYRVLSDRRLNHQPRVAGGVLGVGEDLAGRAGGLLVSFFRSLRSSRRAASDAGPPDPSCPDR